MINKLKSLFRSVKGTGDDHKNIHTDPSSPPFEAYKGNQPYLFISYSHKDSQVVFKELTGLYHFGYRIWYDEGIDPGNEWPDEVAQALEKSAFFIVFISPNSINSQNVKNEINFALNKHKPFLAVHITDAVLPSGLLLRMGDIQAILRYKMDGIAFNKKICRVLPEKLIDNKQKKSPSPVFKPGPETFPEKSNTRIETVVPIQIHQPLSEKKPVEEIKFGNISFQVLHTSDSSGNDAKAFIGNIVFKPESSSNNFNNNHHIKFGNINVLFVD
jgi:hypothetical protein